MKIRIQGNSIRIRLSKTEVDTLSDGGFLEDQTSFGNTSFIYRLKSKADQSALSATYEDHQITMYVPEKFLSDWPDNNIVGLDANMPVGETKTLYLLLEKDFKCLDNVSEDQSDNFENPKKTC